MLKYKFSLAGSLIKRIIEQSPKPVNIDNAYLVDDVLRFFEMNKDHKGVLFCGPPDSVGGRAIGIVDPGPSLMRKLVEVQ